MGSGVVASLTTKIVRTFFFYFPTVESVIVRQAEPGLVPTPQVRVSLTQLETRELLENKMTLLRFTQWKKHIHTLDQSGWGYVAFPKDGEIVVLLTHSCSTFSSGTEL